MFAQLPAGGSSSDLFEGKELYAGRRAPTPLLLEREGSETILTADSGTGVSPVQWEADRQEALAHHHAHAPGRPLELVADYVTVNGSLTNFTFQGDGTYI